MSGGAGDAAPPDAAALDPYRSPASRVEDVAAVTAEDAAFYVLSPLKFWVMSIGTLGLFSYYWFYRNWSGLNRLHKAYWPLPRAIFQILFVHALFREIDSRLQGQGGQHRWNGAATASAYVLLWIGSWVVDRLTYLGVGEPVLDLFGLALIPVCTLPLSRAQRAINVVEGDPTGRSNAHFSAANLAWLAVFGVLWALVLAGLALLLFGELTDV